MKQILTVVFFLLATMPIFSQKENQFASAVINRAKTADLVIEGKVISAEAFWNEDRNQIFTSVVSG